MPPGLAKAGPARLSSYLKNMGDATVMMMLLIATFVVCVLFFIVNIYKKVTLRSALLLVMLLGFCTAFIGFVSYSEYVATASYTVNRLFNGISRFIWQMNYLLKLDIYRAMSLVNTGFLVYVCCALCFSLSYLPSRKWSRGLSIAATAVFGVLCVVYNPYFLQWAFRLNQYNPYTINEQLDRTMNFMNNALSIVTKVCMVAAVLLLFVGYFHLSYRDRRVFRFVVIGLVPIHVLCTFLFYWYPQFTRVLLWRYSLSRDYNFAFNNSTYYVLLLVSVVAMALLLYAAFRYQNFRTVGAKDTIEFAFQINTARMGIYVFSHSIKNQFITIKLLSEQMLRNPATDKEKLLGSITGICEESITKLSDVYRNLSSIPLAYEQAELVEYISAIVEEHRKTNPGVAYRFVYQRPVITAIDKDQFSRVLNNLMVNAREACCEAVPQDKAPQIELSLKTNRRDIVLSVQDNGPGIPKRQQRQIFYPFFSTKPTATNWGIGLSYCHEVMESFGGSINVSCPGLEGQGTTFKLYLPYSAEYAKRIET